MSFYRTLLAALAAVVIASPVFADDTTGTSSDQTGTGATSTTTSSETTTTTSSSTEQGAKINLNTATASELMKVKGLNASKARAIVSYRKKNGNFKSLDDLANVKGFKKIKPDTLKSIQDQLSVD